MARSTTDCSVRTSAKWLPDLWPPLSPADASLEIGAVVAKTSITVDDNGGEARMRISLILAFALLASELLPASLTRADRRHNDLGISSTFAMALVITGPIGF